MISQGLWKAVLDKLWKKLVAEMKVRQEQRERTKPKWFVTAKENAFYQKLQDNPQ